MEINLKKRREAIDISIEVLSGKWGIPVSVLEDWEETNSKIPYPLVFEEALIKLEKEYMWEKEEEPFYDHLIQKISGAVRHSDAVLAGVE